MTYFVHYINPKKQKETIKASEQGQMNIKDFTDCKHNLAELAKCSYGYLNFRFTTEYAFPRLWFRVWVGVSPLEY